MEATAEIPKVQFAKVGEKREKKKGGLPLWLRGGKAGSAFSGALGGEGAGGGGSFLGSLGALGGEGGAAEGAGLFMRIFPKLIMASIVASMGIGAYGLRMALSPQPKRPFAARPKKIFDSPAAAQKYSGDVSSLPGGGQSYQSGLSMVRGSLDDGSASAQPAAQQQAQAGQDANAQAAASASPATPDAAAIAAAAAAGAGGGAGAGGAGKNGPFATRFGQLSSAFGGSPFSSGGMFGGVGSPFSGKIKGFDSQAPVARAAAPSAASAHNPATRLAARQLNNAFLGARGAQAAMGNGTSMENASYKAAQPFDNGGAANGIVQGPTGSATPQGGAGATPGSPDSNNSSGGGYDSSNPSAGGTPQNPMTDCVQLLGPNYTNTSNGGCVQTTAGTDVTPWGSLSTMAAIALIASAALLMIASFLMTSSFFPLTVWPTALMLAKIAAGLALVASALGAAIMAQGQTWSGMMYTVPGLLMATSAIGMVMTGTGAHANKLLAWDWAMYGGMISGALGGIMGGIGLAHSSSSASSMQ